MEKFLKHLATSIVAADLCALNFYMFFVVYLAEDFKYISLLYQIKGYLMIATFVFTVGFLVTFIQSIIIGLPLYFLVKKVANINLLTLVGGGIAIAIIPVLICKELGFHMPRVADKGGVVLLLSLAICGGVGGFTFWIMDKRSKLAGRANREAST